jgi:hypothetical protein
LLERYAAVQMFLDQPTRRLLALVLHLLQLATLQVVLNDVPPVSLRERVQAVSEGRSAPLLPCLALLVPLALGTGVLGIWHWIGNLEDRSARATGPREGTVGSLAAATSMRRRRNLQ